MRDISDNFIHNTKLFVELDITDINALPFWFNSLLLMFFIA